MKNMIILPNRILFAVISFFSYFDVIYLLALNVWANRVQMITEYRDKMRFFSSSALDVGDIEDSSVVMNL